jgi:adenylyl cyclase-associated protein
MQVQFTSGTPISSSLPAPAPSAAAPQSASTEQATSSPSSSSISAYQTLLDTKVADLLNAAEAIGGEVLSATRIVAAAFQSELQIIAAFASCPKPTDPSAIQPLLQPTAEKIMEAGTLTSGPRSQYADHFKTLSEAAQALTWVAYQPGCGLALPPQHVEDAWGAAEFYANKVLMQWKPKGPEHGLWVAALKAAVLSFQKYCAQYHATGPAWNPNGTANISTFKYDAKTSGNGGSSSVAPVIKKKAGPPPPPPPPPPGTLIQPKQQQPAPTTTTTTAPSSGGAMAALFADINKGTSVTAGLKKVTDDMKTKNRSDRTSTVPSSTTSSTTSTVTGTNKVPSTTKASTQPPRFECEQGRKWVIEHQINNRDNGGLIIENTEPKQTVYIYNCHDSTIQVRGKVNAITLDGCSKCGLVFDTVVAVVEVVNCTSVQIQCTGAAPTVSVEKTDGCQLFMYIDELEKTEITSAKISEFNVVALIKNGDGGAGDGNGEEEPQEFAIPEQYVSRYRNGKMVTETVTHSGG